MDNPFPLPLDVEAGQCIRWCACGQSKTQPFCDRDDCGDKAVTFQARFSDTLYICSCKQSRNPPFCDGSHAKVLMDMIKDRSIRD